MLQMSRRSLLSAISFAMLTDALVANDDQDIFQSGNSEVDKGVRPTLEFLSRLFGLTDAWLPDFSFINDGDSPNSFAVIPIVGDSGPLTRPQIKIGRGLVAEIIKSANGDFGAALTGVFAHEFAHLHQMKSGYRTQLTAKDIQSSQRLLECHADFLAGWALPQAFWITQVSDLAIAAKQFYALGDMDFELGSHHGSHLQRQSIMASGYTFGLISPNDPDAAAERGLTVLFDLFPQWFKST
jgi:hypothetical protein